MEIGEVQYFFRANIAGTEQALALLSVFSGPDLDIYNQSLKTIRTGVYRGEASLIVVPVKSIMSVIAMCPWAYSGPNLRDSILFGTGEETNEFVVNQKYWKVESLTLGFAEKGGVSNSIPDED